MCTLVIVHKSHPRYPLIVMANRDEFFIREADPPHIFGVGPVGSPRVLAGRDRLAGGTWMGINDRGLLAAVTNRRSESGRNPSLLSRGRLVLDCLSCGSAAEAEALLDRTDGSGYNLFNLLLADVDRAVARSNADGGRRCTVARKPFAIANGDLADRTAPELVWAEGAAADLPAEEGPLVDRLRLACGSHDGAEADPFRAMCVHTEIYGTVSSTILLHTGVVGGGCYLHCEGPPCRGGYEDLSDLLRRLDEGPEASPETGAEPGPIET